MDKVELGTWLNSLSADQLLRALGRNDWTDLERALVQQAWERRQLVTYEEDLQTSAAGMSTDELLRCLRDGLGIQPERDAFAQELRRRTTPEPAAR